MDFLFRTLCQDLATVLPVTLGGFFLAFLLADAAELRGFKIGCALGMITLGAAALAIRYVIDVNNSFVMEEIDERGVWARAGAYAVLVPVLFPVMRMIEDRQRRESSESKAGSKDGAS